MNVSIKEKIIALGGYLIPLIFQIPVFNILALFLYLILFYDQSKFILNHIKESLNIQIMFQSLYFIIATISVILMLSFDQILEDGLVILLLSGLSNIWLIIILAIIYLLWLIITIIAIIMISIGKAFRLPVIPRTFKLE